MTKEEMLKNVKNTLFFKTMKRNATGAGYELECCWVKDGFLRFEVSPTKEYAPSIYYNDMNDEGRKFEMQTTSYGALSGDELMKFMDAMNSAFAFVEFLNNTEIWERCPVLDLEK